MDFVQIFDTFWCKFCITLQPHWKNERKERDLTIFRQNWSKLVDDLRRTLGVLLEKILYFKKKIEIDHRCL